MKLYQIALALGLVLSAGGGLAAGGGQPARPHAPSTDAAGQHARQAPSAPLGAIVDCLPADRGGLAPGQPDYADTRRELAQRAQHGATAAERKHAAEMLDRIKEDEAAARKQAGKQAGAQPLPLALCR